jgi:hypothetical protein
MNTPSIHINPPSGFDHRCDRCLTSSAIAPQSLAAGTLCAAAAGATNLEHLNLCNTKVTAPGVALVKKALLRCEVLR